MDKYLAKITSAKLEIQERGILNFWINLAYEDGFCQGFGGIALDTYDKAKESRVGTAFGCEVIRKLLLALEVNDFSEMKGKIVWVYAEGNEFNKVIKGIGPLSVNSKEPPVIIEDILNEFKD